MPSTKTVSPRTVRAVQNLRNDGKTWETIGKTLGRSANWGIQLLKNYDGATGLRKEERQKTGRKRKTTETEDFVMEAVATTFREYSYQDIASVLKEHNLTVISEKTVQKPSEAARIPKNESDFGRADRYPQGAAGEMGDMDAESITIGYSLHPSVVDFRWNDGETRRWRNA